MRVEIVETGTEDGAKAAKRFTASALRRLQRVVEVERATHPYTNRTRHAHNTTGLIGDVTDDGIDVDVHMGAEYASYLNNVGWSRFYELLERELAAIDAEANRLD